MFFCKHIISINRFNKIFVELKDIKNWTNMNESIDKVIIIKCRKF